MANPLPPVPNNPLTDTFVWRDWFFKVYQALKSGATTLWTGLNFSGSNIRDIETRQHNALQDIQGGTTDQYYHLSLSKYTFVNSPPFIEAVETGAGPFVLSTTPQLLIPTTVNNANHITYDNTNGEFTFELAGTYDLTLAVNVESTSANQKVYIYAENNTGSGWITNTNSGKQVELVNGAVTQVTLPVGTRRVAGQKVRYFIYASSTNVRLLTTTFGTTGAIVPAIRIIYK